MVLQQLRKSNTIIKKESLVLQKLCVIPEPHKGKGVPMKKFFTITSILLSSYVAQAQQPHFCTVSTAGFSELENSVSQTQLCSDVVKTLTEQTVYTEGYPLNITVLKKTQNGFVLSISFLKHESYQLIGTELWTQDQTGFTLN